MAKILLEMKNITKTFPGVKALDNVNLQVEEGEIHALVGENGAGKSTLMNVLSGIYPYGTYDGNIIYNGEICKFNTIKDSEEKGIVIIHQELALIPYMTIGENMYLGNEKGKSFSINWNETYGEADKYLKIVGLEESSRTLIKDIGVGKQQLVEIAKALAKNAKLLILDEPTSYLDVRHKLEFLSILQKLCRERELTVILSLHELELAEKISDRILCVNGRAVDRIGTPEEVMTAGYITELYGIRMGSYDEGSSDMELAAPEGTPQVFVIAGAGSGRKIYRRLQRAGIPFVTGILHENDLDYPVAKALAAEVIAEHPFEPVAQEKIQAAKKQLEKCNRVICCRENFGSLETYQRELLEYAEQLGKQIEKSESPE